MKLIDLMKEAAAGFADPTFKLKDYFDPVTGKPLTKPEIPRDSLPRLIVREIAETFDPRSATTDTEQIKVAVDMLNDAVFTLETTVSYLEEVLEHAYEIEDEAQMKEA